MKREIKFRAWDNVDYMSSPFTLQDIQERKIQFTSDAVLMQFTGLLDKNGKEIYEGDILKRGHEINPHFLLEVSFNVHLGFAGTTHPGQNHTKPLSYMMKHEGAEYTEIIGNIYQNPLPHEPS